MGTFRSRMTIPASFTLVLSTLRGNHPFGNGTWEKRMGTTDPAETRPRRFATPRPAREAAGEWKLTPNIALDRLT